MSSKKKNIAFNAMMDKELLDLMYKQVLLGRKADRGFKMDAYKHVARTMTEHSDGVYILTSQAVQNRCKHLKKNYAIVTEMLNGSGFGYDNTTKRIIAEDDVWTAWLQGYPKALPYKSYTIDYNKLTICFGKNVATGQYARSATTAPSRQSTESGAANFTPLQLDSDVGLTDQLGGVRIQSSSIEAFSRRMNARKRNSELMEIIHRIERSSEGLTTAIRDVADTIRLPKRQHSMQILVELSGIPALSSLDVELANEWLTVHQDMATVFITADNKEEWILRQMPRIRDALRF
ncbi:hypothetical protein AAC387_Pa07g1915 [Persea americana]